MTLDKSNKKKLIEFVEKVKSIRSYDLEVKQDNGLYFFLSYSIEGTKRKGIYTFEICKDIISEDLTPDEINRRMDKMPSKKFLNEDNVAQKIIDWLEN